MNIQTSRRCFLEIFTKILLKLLWIISSCIMIILMNISYSQLKVVFIKQPKTNMQNYTYNKQQIVLIPALRITPSGSMFLRFWMFCSSRLVLHRHTDACDTNTTFRSVNDAPATFCIDGTTTAFDAKERRRSIDGDGKIELNVDNRSIFRCFSLADLTMEAVAVKNRVEKIWIKELLGDLITIVWVI